MNFVERICVPKDMEELVSRCACSDVWEKDRKLGKGGFGTVFKVCLGNNCDYAMKVQPYDKYGKAELEAYLGLKSLNVTPKMYAAWICRKHIYIVVERLWKCSPNARILNRLNRLLDKMKDKGWLHGDVHHGNIMCNARNRLCLVDFGLSVKKGKASYSTHHGKSYKQIKKKQETQLKELDRTSSYYESD